MKSNETMEFSVKLHNERHRMKHFEKLNTVKTKQ